MSISTHVLDTARGTPAAGLGVTLHRREPNGDWKEVGTAVTDSDGRIRELTEDELEPGEYRLEFDTRPYFERPCRSFSTWKTVTSTCLCS